MSNSIISENLRTALCEQISAERYNSGVYMFIAGYLKNKGLDGLAKQFVYQVDEEHEHSKLIFEFLTDMNADVEIRDINSVNMQFKSIVDIATAYLDREQITTQSLIEEKDIAIEDKDGVSEEFLRHMIDKQRIELAEATTFMDNALLAGSDWWHVKVWSDSLG
jgi:ferritin